MKRINILWLVMLLPSLLQAQQKWKLKDCIDYGLKNNRSNTVYANEKKLADAKSKEALAAYLPTVSLSGSLDNNLKVQESIIPAGLFGPNDIRVAFTQKFSSNLTAQLDQTIYDKSLLTGLKANKYNSQQAILNQQLNDETIIYNISTAFYQIFVYREQLALLKVTLETYASQLEISKLQVSKGTAIETDLNRIVVNYNNTHSQITGAESNLTLAENQLKLTMGFPLMDQIKIEEAKDLSSSPDVSGNETNDSLSVGNLTNYQLSKVNTSLLQIDQKRISAGMFPKLTAYARYGAVGFGNSLSPALSDLSAFSAVGLKLNFPIFDFFKRNAQYNQAKYKYLNGLENLKLDEDRYHMDFENAMNKLTKAEINLQNDSRNVKLAQSVFNTTNLQYQKGVKDLRDWLDAQREVNEAQNNYLSSLYNFYLAKIDLQKAKGTLKTFYNSL